MLIYSDNLERLIRRKFLSRILISPKNFKLKGSFSRKTQYVTDVDVCTYFDPVYLEKPARIYERLRKIVYYIAGQSEVIFVEAKCGYDDTYMIVDASDVELDRVSKKLRPGDRVTFDKLVKEHGHDRSILVIALRAFFKKIYRYHWSLEEIYYDQKVCYDGSIVRLTDVLMENDNILVRYFINCQGYYIGVDSANYYSKKARVSVREKYNDLLPAYRQEKMYYPALFIMRYRLRKTHYDAISRIIDRKYGVYKQLLTQIDNYLKMLALDLIDYPIAENIRSKLLVDLPNSSHVNLSDLLQKLRESHDLFDWSVTLRKIQDRLEEYLNTDSRNAYYQCLELLPTEERSMYTF